MKAHFTFIFGAFEPLEIAFYRGQSAIKSLKKMCSPAQTIPWASGSTEWWSMQPDIYFTGFQRFFWARADGSSLPLSIAALAGSDSDNNNDSDSTSDGYVLLIKRAAPPEGHIGPWTGTQRRRLSEAFWEAVVQELRNQGVSFLVVELETQPLAQQVALFQGASVVVGIHGGVFSNINFCRPGTLVLEHGRLNVHHPFYMNLAQKMGLEYRHRDSEAGEALALVVSQEAASHQQEEQKEQGHSSAVELHAAGDVTAPMPASASRNQFKVINLVGFFFLILIHSSNK